VEMEANVVHGGIVFCFESGEGAKGGDGGDVDSGRNSGNDGNARAGKGGDGGKGGDAYGRSSGAVVRRSRLHRPLYQ
jgi:hypothetical protein